MELHSQGIVYFIRRTDSPKWDTVAAARGVLRRGGQVWDNTAGEWVHHYDTAGRFAGSMFDSNDPRNVNNGRGALGLPTGGEWVECFVNVSPDKAGN